VAQRVAGELPRGDPLAAAWASAPEHVAPLEAQNQVAPKLLDPGVARVRVRALHDGAWIALRLEWEDPSRDVVVGPGRMSDAVALELPMSLDPDLPDPAMGHPGRPVQILYWKAAWQDTQDPTAALRPNLAVDHYPFGPSYSVAQAAGNAVALRQPGVGVAELLAAGAGTLTPAKEPHVAGQGVWRDGHWSVTLARPLGPPFDGRRPTHVAMAVWDGASGHVGGKKMRSAWVPISLGGMP
jgi:hypothetical protein